MTITTVAPTGPTAPAGRTGPGKVSINDRVVEKMASRAAAEIPDAGGAAARILGREIAGAAVLGGRETSLDSLPRVSAEVDGSVVVLSLSISVRWPAPVPEVCDAVRQHVRDRLAELTGLTVAEVSITVTDLITRAAAPRVR
jgi:uncharacterized alkaline shock family protein YloU